MKDSEAPKRKRVSRSVRLPGEHDQVRRYPEQRVEKKSANQLWERFRVVRALFQSVVRIARKRAGRGNSGGQEVDVRTDIKTGK